MRERPEGRREDLQEREQLRNVLVLHGLVPGRGTGMTDQRHLAGVGGDVGTDAGVVHAVEADPALHVVQALLGGGRGDPVVDGGRDEIFRAGIEDDVGRQSQIADRVVLHVMSEAAFVVLRVGWRRCTGDELQWCQAGPRKRFKSQKRKQTEAGGAHFFSGSALT